MYTSFLNIIVLAICTFFLGLISSCSTKSANVVEYHQIIQNEVQIIKDDYLLLSELLGSRDKPAIETQVNQLNKRVRKSVKRLNELPTIANDFEYKLLAIKQLQVLDNNLTTRYPKIINLIGVSNPTDDEVEQLERIYEEIEDLEEPLFEQFERASALFTKKNKIKNTEPIN